MNKIVYIYTLSCPYSGEVRYVGKTNEAMQRRLRRHITNQTNTWKGNWIKSLLNDGKVPVMDLIDEVNSSEWIFWEQHYISLFKSWGFRLTNATIGGEGAHGAKKSENEKRAIGERNSIPVYQFTISGVLVKRWSSQSLIQVEAGIRQSAISHSIRRGTICNGFLWSLSNTPPILKDLYRKKPIIHNQTGIRYETSRSAARALDLDPSLIRKVANGDVKQYKGNTFSFAALDSTTLTPNT